MTDKIEEVARAMWEATHLSEWCSRACTGIDKDTYREHARAAIAAIIPEGMVRVPREAVDLFERDTFVKGYLMAFDVDDPPSDDEVELAWNTYSEMFCRKNTRAAMIQAAEGG